MFNDWPVTLVQLVSVPGLAILASILGLWLKFYIDDTRRIPALILLFTVVVGEFAQVVYTTPWADWRAALTALLIAFILALIAASLAVFGYEMVVNALGMAGIGPRANRRIDHEKEGTHCTT